MALLEKGEAKDSLANALQAEALLERLGQQELTWRVLLVAAQASNRLGDSAKAKEYGSRAQDYLKTLEQKWGSAAFQNYSNRPDVRTYRNRLERLLTST